MKRKLIKQGYNTLTVTLPKKWTKKQIIDLYNNSEASKESNIQYSSKSLSSKRLLRIVTEICDILSHNQLHYRDRS